MVLHIDTEGMRSIGRRIWEEGEAFWLLTVGLFSGLVVSGWRLARAQEGCTVTVHPGDSIQSAIDAAPQGTVICLGEGTWQENIHITKSLTIRGQGPEKTVIRAAGASPIVAKSGEGIQVALDVVRVTQAHSDAGTSGIEVGGSAQVTISNNTVQANKRYGISLREAPCFDTDSAFTGCVTGKNNVIQDNGKGDVCPPELGFLTTEKGGTLDRRK